MRDIDERYKGDVAKQRFKYNPEFCCINLDIEDLSPAICGKSYGTDEQMIVMTHAFEMLDVLEGWARDTEVANKAVPMCVRVVIKKARGGE